MRCKEEKREMKKMTGERGIVKMKRGEEESRERKKNIGRGR